MKALIIFVFGAAAGGVAAFFGTKKYMEKKFERMSEENKELKEYLDFLRSKDEAGEMAQNLGYTAKDGDAQNEAVKADGSSKKEKKVDYTRFYKEISDEASEQLGMPFSPDDIKGVHKKTNKEKAASMAEFIVERLAEEQHPEDDEGEEVVDKDEYDLKEAMELLNDTKRKPIVIGPSEFDNYPYMDKTALYYYQPDDVLATENDEELDDPDALLGEVFEQSGFKTNDEEVIYIRNFSRGTDYEIGKVFSPFHE